MDADGSGHAGVVMLFDDDSELNFSVYISRAGRIFTLGSDSLDFAVTGLFRSQTIPLGGFTAANIFPSAMLFEAVGVDPSNNLASVIVGGFSPSACNPTSDVVGEYDENDGGNVTGSSPVALTGSFVVDPTVPGFGTLTFTNGLESVFYMRSPGGGDSLKWKRTQVISASRIVGNRICKPNRNGGFTLATLNGITQNVGTVTTTPASANGVMIINFGSGAYTASTDGSALRQSPFLIT